MAKKSDTDTEAAPVTEAPAANSQAGTPIPDFLPPAAAEEKARADKPFVVVTKWLPVNDSANYHAKQAQSHLSQLGVEAQIVPTIDGSGELHLLIDASLSLGDSVPA